MDLNNVKLTGKDEVVDRYLPFTTFAISTKPIFSPTKSFIPGSNATRISVSTNCFAIHRKQRLKTNEYVKENRKELNHATYIRPHHLQHVWQNMVSESITSGQRAFTRIPIPTLARDLVNMVTPAACPTLTMNL